MAPISGSAFQVSHLLLHSYMLMWSVEYQHWYVRGCFFSCIGHLIAQKERRHVPYDILKMIVNGASMIVSC
jgi:hypothetical protein